MKFFADHCVSNSMITALREAGHEVLRLRDHIPVESEDEAVIAKAGEISAVLLSLNGDFADIVSFPPRDFHGIVSIQLRNRPQIAGALMSRLLHYLAQHPSTEHYRGRLFLIEVDRIRVRA